jgi:phosphoglycolate phosphatase
VARAVSVLPGHIRGVLFDKDGTLVDFDRTWSGTMKVGARDFADGDETLATRLCEAVGWNEATGTFAADAFFANNPNAAIARRWRELRGLPFADSDSARLDALFARAILASVTPLGDLAGTVKRLRARGLVLGVATNDSRESAVEQLAALGVGEAFIFVTGYDGPSAPKPDPSAVFDFARAAGIAPSEVAVVGDSLNDLNLAGASGAYSIAVARDPLHRAVLAPLADIAISGIEAL